MVTIYKMNENEMDNRGSKSAIFAVKEQRVYGNQEISLIPLRSTLMGFERNYRINNPSKQLKINKLSFSTLNNKPKIDP
jgi:hypothetical protein